MCERAPHTLQSLMAQAMQQQPQAMQLDVMQSVALPPQPTMAQPSPQSPVQQQQATQQLQMELSAAIQQAQAAMASVALQQQQQTTQHQHQVCCYAPRVIAYLPVALEENSPPLPQQQQTLTLLFVSSSTLLRIPFSGIGFHINVA